jgi:hypothetical protein
VTFFSIISYQNSGQLVKIQQFLGYGKMDYLWPASVFSNQGTVSATMKYLTEIQLGLASTNKK